MNQQSSISVQIEGMSCASCVGRAEKALAMVPGVTTAVVNLANESAQINGDNTLENQAIVSALATAGYPAVTDEITLDVSNMSCASCVGRLEKVVEW